MTNLERLQAVEFCFNKLEYILETYEKQRTMSNSLVSHLDGVTVQKNKNVHKVEEAVIQVEKLKELAEIWQGRYIEAWNEAEKVIDKISDPTANAILHYKYLLLFDWATIAQKTGKKESRCKTLHTMALKQLQ